MIYKRCPRCGARIPEGTTCRKCELEKRRTSNRTDGVRKEYKTQRWKDIRQYCLNRYDNLDLYALYHDGQIIAADRVHHIVEALEAPELFYDTENHFPVSDGSHQDIHRRMKMEPREIVQDELRKYLKMWRETMNDSMGVPKKF